MGLKPGHETDCELCGSKVGVQFDYEELRYICAECRYKERNECLEFDF